MEKKHIKETLIDIAAGKEEEALFYVCLRDMDELNDEELDIILIKNMAELARKLCVGTMDQSWRAQSGDIAEGEYPLEKLPAHVREIARELYYV